MSKRLPTVVEQGEDDDDDNHHHVGHSEAVSLKKVGAAIRASNRLLPDLVSQKSSKPSSRATSPATSIADSSCSTSTSRRKLKLPPVKQGLSAAGKELLAYLQEERLDIGEIEDMLRDSRMCKAVNERDEAFGWTPLHFMANRGHTHLVKVLLDSKAHPDVTCNLGNTPLHLATRCNHMHVVTFLVARHAALNCRNDNGWTALMCGAMTGHRHAISSLISASADAEVVDTQGRNASMWAARHGHGSILQAILSKAPNLDVCDFDGLTVAEHAQAHRDLRRAVRKLFECNRLLLRAARTDNMEEAIDALNDGAVVNARDSEGGSAIGWASTNGSEQMVMLLLQHHADPSLANWRPDWASDGFLDDGTSMTEAIRGILRNQSRLLNAARSDDWEDALDALHTVVCINNKDNAYQRTAFIWAAIHGAADAVEQIFAAHADIEERDSVGWTAVHYAVHHGQSEALAALYHIHANFEAQTWEGDFAQHLAAKSGNWRMLYMLKAAKVDMEAINTEGLTCLQVAVICQQPLAISALLALKANHETKDHHERTLFHLAVVNGHADIARLLVESVHPPKYELCGASGHAQRRRGSTSRHTGKKHKNARARADKLHADHHSDEEGAEDAPSHGKEVKDGHHNHERKHTHAKHRRQSKKEDHDRHEHEADDHSENEDKHDEAESHADVGEHKHQKPRRASKEHHDEVEQEHEDDPPHSARSGHSSVHGSDTHSTCTRGHPRRTSVARSVSSASSSKLGKRRQRGEASTESRTMTSLMLMARVLCEGLPDNAPPLLAARNALTVRDADKRTALALVLHFRHSVLVPTLIEQKADVNDVGANGTTMLMSAAAWGERSVVDNLLVARARVEAKDDNGQQAVHYATNREIRRTLELLLQKDQVQRRLASTDNSTQQHKLPKSKASSKSMPALHATKKRDSAGGGSHKSPIYRLRLESLPVRLPADMLESHIRSMLKRRGNLDPLNMSVAVDPITQKPQGYAYLDFTDPRKADSLIRAGGDILFGGDDSGLLFASAVKVAKEATIITTDDLN